MIYIPGVLNSV